MLGGLTGSRLCRSESQPAGEGRCWTLRNDGADLLALAWPTSRLGEAIEALVRRAQLASQMPTAVVTPPPLLEQADEETIGRWIEVIASQFGVEVEPTQAMYSEVEQLVRGAGPAVLRLPDEGGTGERRFLVLLRGGRRRIVLLGPDLSVYHMQCEVVRAALCQEREAPHVRAIEQLLVSAGVPAQHHRGEFLGAGTAGAATPRLADAHWRV